MKITLTFKFFIESKTHKNFEVVVFMIFANLRNVQSHPGNPVFV
jgi:hypothetical protein